MILPLYMWRRKYVLAQFSLNRIYNANSLEISHAYNSLKRYLRQAAMYKQSFHHILIIFKNTKMPYITDKLQRIELRHIKQISYGCIGSICCLMTFQSNAYIFTYKVKNGAFYIAQQYQYWFPFSSHKLTITHKGVFQENEV